MAFVCEYGIVEACIWTGDSIVLKSSFLKYFKTRMRILILKKDGLEMSTDVTFNTLCNESLKRLK